MQRLLNKLASQVHQNRLACREAWWQLQQTVCLENAPVGGTRGAVPMPSGGAGDGAVVKGSGAYLPGQGVQVVVNWGSSTTMELLKEV